MWGVHALHKKPPWVAVRLCRPKVEFMEKEFLRAKSLKSIFSDLLMLSQKSASYNFIYLHDATNNLSYDIKYIADDVKYLVKSIKYLLLVLSTQFLV